MLISATWLYALANRLSWEILILKNNSLQLMARAVFVALTMRWSKAGTWVWTLTPEKSQNYSFSLAILVLIPWKITKLPSQHSMLGHHRPPNETPWRFADGSTVVRFQCYSDHIYPQQNEEKTLLESDPL